MVPIRVTALSILQHFAPSSEQPVRIDTFAFRFREAVDALYPQRDDVRLSGWIRSRYVEDQRAVCFYFDRDACGLDLTDEQARQYVVNASVLNTCIALYGEKRAVWSTMGGKWDWSRMFTVIEGLRREFGHTLPGSVVGFRRKVSVYRREGYAGLLSGKFGNQSARKVGRDVEQLLVSIACQVHQPYNRDVWMQFCSFMRGELDVYDRESGELYDPAAFVDGSGQLIELSESTVNGVLNQPKNRLVIEAAHRSWSNFYHEQMPHVHRHGGQWSLSQITMDDVDLTRKLKDTKQRVHAYYAYDVVSQCVIGASYGRKKDVGLVLDCFRDMFRLIAHEGWGMPAGIEVENHLMSQYKDGFLKAGEVFPFVRFCAPLNSQEKYAEQLNGAKKRSVIHKNHAGIGRFYGKGKWRVDYEKVSSETNDEWEDREYFGWDELVADDRQDTWEWNHALHPDQKKFPGMTRWDVLTGRQNPDLRPLASTAIAKYVGEKVETSIKRNSTVRVAGREWWLSGPEVLELLKPNDYRVTAYYLPDADGGATDVYLWQGEKYLCQLEAVETFNRVLAEQTDEDRAKFTVQEKKISHFRKYVEEHAAAKVGVVRSLPLDVGAVAAAVVAPVAVSEEEEAAPYYDGQSMHRRAVGDI